MAKYFLEQSENQMQLIPIDGDCPKCSNHLMWTDLIKYKSLVDQNENNNGDDDDEDDDEDDDDDFEERDDDENDEDENDQNLYEFY
jgi:hypothetical protein